MDGKVETKTSNGIATITFFHPQSNSLPRNILKNLADEITSTGNNPDAKVIIIRSENPISSPSGRSGGAVFCAGASFDELIAIKNFEEGKQFFLGFATVINAMRKVPKFIIARVHGKAVGGGLGLISASDYALAVENASVKLSELAIGIGPFVVGPAVERKIGTSAFAHLSINATEWQTAQWAKEKNLYADVFPTVAELDKAVNSLAEKLSNSNPEAMAQLKKVMWEGTERWDKLLLKRAEISGKLVLSEFTKKAIEKFK